MGLLQLIKGRQQEVVLPILIGKTVYIVAGERGYEGDLVLTENVIYYFPHTDLIRRRIGNATHSALLVAFGGLGGVLPAVLNQNRKGSQQRDNSDLPSADDVTASLEEKLDAYIQTRREERKDGLMGESLPLPMRFPKGEIQGLWIASKNFGFDASFDNHRFIPGNFGLLKGALKAGAYLA